jgi:hypothetical protein
MSASSPRVSRWKGAPAGQGGSIGDAPERSGNEGGGSYWCVAASR